MQAQIITPPPTSAIPEVIEGVVWKPLVKFSDSRGWLLELFRDDECPPDFNSVMAYVSETNPGIVRGPHEHREQTDYFCFFGPSRFRVYLWDNRPGSPTLGAYQTETVGEGRPMLLMVPPGVVHAYKNVGDSPGIVWNAPDRLFAGPGRSEPIDEIRHENDPYSRFLVD